MNALRWLCISSLIICATLPSGYSNNDIASNSSYIAEAICDDHASVDLYELGLEGYLQQEELPALEQVITEKERLIVSLPYERVYLFDAAVRKHQEDVTVELNDAIYKGWMTAEEAEQQYWHEIWSRVAKEIGFIYVRTEW